VCPLPGRERRGPLRPVGPGRAPPPRDRYTKEAPDDPEPETLHPLLRRDPRRAFAGSGRISGPGGTGRRPGRRTGRVGTRWQGGRRRQATPGPPEEIGQTQRRQPQVGTRCLAAAAAAPAQAARGQTRRAPTPAQAARGQTRRAPTPAQAARGQTRRAPTPAQAAHGQTRCAPTPAQAARGQTRCAPTPAQAARGQTRRAPTPAQAAGGQTRCAPTPAQEADGRPRFAAARGGSPAAAARNPPQDAAPNGRPA
jgi:hypothetical protein